MMLWDGEVVSLHSRSAMFTFVLGILLTCTPRACQLRGGDVYQ